MNIDTGELINNDEYGKLSIEQMKRFVEVCEDDMTDKQKENNQVSLHDHISTLGKKLTYIRSINGLTKNQKRNLRKKGFIR